MKSKSNKTEKMLIKLTAVIRFEREHFFAVWTARWEMSRRAITDGRREAQSNASPT